MAGEELEDTVITSHGLLGDRAYALVDGRKKVGTARKLKGILDCRARFQHPPRPDEHEPPPVIITMPDGRTVDSARADSTSILSEFFSHDVSLHSSPSTGLALEFAAGTLGGKHAATTEFPLAAGSPSGTFFDYATVHIVTTSSLTELSQENPTGRFDVRRFRPNIVVETANGGFVENAWLGRVVALGDTVRLRVIMPCPRCVITTLPQAELPQDPGILRTAAQQNRMDLGDFGNLPCVGVYADVLEPGEVRRGDVVRVLD